MIKIVVAVLLLASLSGCSVIPTTPAQNKAFCKQDPDFCKNFQGGAGN